MSSPSLPPSLPLLSLCLSLTLSPLFPSLTLSFSSLSLSLSCQTRVKFKGLYSQPLNLSRILSLHLGTNLCLHPLYKWRCHSLSGNWNWRLMLLLQILTGLTEVVDCGTCLQPLCLCALYTLHTPQRTAVCLSLRSHWCGNQSTTPGETGAHVRIVAQAEKHLTPRNTTT